MRWHLNDLISASVNHLRFVRGAKELLSASEDTDAHLWDIETTEIIQTYGKGFEMRFDWWTNQIPELVKLILHPSKDIMQGP